ncbi:MAG: hypothetical protein AB7S86_07020 [Hydrogenophaga sp.]|uniref:hypothetical protein n=1 Tax=Hydrogenophaga sp. TaxID=1904254 RepID=UPI003D13094E
MINLPSSSAVSWPTPPSAAVAPVSPVPAVPALQSGGESQTGPRSGHNGRGHAFPSPGQRPSHGQTTVAGDTPAAARPTAGDHQTQAVQRKAELEAHAAREREKQAMEHLKEVLTNVWQASAAVVDRALGRDPSAPGTQSDTAPDLSQVAASLISRRVVASPSAASARSGAAPHNANHGYDAQGNRRAETKETGSLLSHRV